MDNMYHNQTFSLNNTHLIKIGTNKIRIQDYSLSYHFNSHNSNSQIYSNNPIRILLVEEECIHKFRVKNHKLSNQLMFNNKASLMHSSNFLDNFQDFNNNLIPLVTRILFIQEFLINKHRKIVLNRTSSVNRRTKEHLHTLVSLSSQSIISLCLVGAAYSGLNIHKEVILEGSMATCLEENRNDNYRFISRIIFKTLYL